MDNSKTLKIAIDGTAASGKSTVAKLLAQHLGVSYLDTGKLYRAVALTFLAQESKTPEQWDDNWALTTLAKTTLLLKARPNDECRVLLDGEDVTDRLGESQVERATPYAARLPSVRAWLLDLQRDLARTSDVVMAGRDIGTIVLPQATLKVFMEADLEERARRRLLQQGGQLEQDRVKQAVSELAARDERDSKRDVAPMRAAEDAVVLNSTSHSPQELVAEIVRLLRERAETP